MSAPVLNRRLVLEEAQRVADGAGGGTARSGPVWVSCGVRSVPAGAASARARV